MTLASRARQWLANARRREGLIVAIAATPLVAAAVFVALRL